MDFKCFSIFREHAEIFACYLLADILLPCRVDKGDARPFETGSAETSSIDSVTLTHYVIDGDKLLASAFIILYGTLAALETKLAEQSQVTCLPSSYADSNPLVFSIEMFRTTGEAGRHPVFCLLKYRLGHIPEKSLVKSFERHLSICHHIPCGCLAFRHT